MKKISAILIALMLALSVLAGCSNNSAGSDNASTASPYKIGVLQMVAHPALDSSYEGFVAALNDAGLKEGVDYTIDLQNAQGKTANCQTMASKLVNDGNDLIFAIATPAAQAVANVTKEIPIVVTAVTDPADAGLVESNELPGTNVTGSSDMGPIKQQIELIKELIPDIEKLGIFYCSGESNSVLQASIARAEAEALGLEVEEFTVTDTKDVQQVTQSMVGKVDAVYIPTDNMLANAMPAVASVANENMLPVVPGEEGMVNNGGLATYSLDYFKLGKLAGQQAIEILKDGKDPATMPIVYQEDLNFIYNEDTAKALGIEIPAHLIDK